MLIYERVVNFEKNAGNNTVDHRGADIRTCQ